jgi:hypothetical protein
MPTPMTPRERALTALRGDMPDQIPFISYSEMLPTGAARQRLHALGLAAFDRIEPYRIRRNEVTVETRQIRDETYPAVLTTYHTPIGTLTQKQIVGPGYGSLWTKEYLIKRPEDYAVYELDIFRFLPANFHSSVHPAEYPCLAHKQGLPHQASP